MFLIRTPLLDIAGPEDLIRASLVLFSLTRGRADTTEGPRETSGAGPWTRIASMQLLMQSGLIGIDDLWDLDSGRIVEFEETAEQLASRASLDDALALLDDLRNEIDEPLRSALTDLQRIDHLDDAGLVTLVEARGGFGVVPPDCRTAYEKRGVAFSRIAEDILRGLPDSTSLSFSLGTGLELLGGRLEPLPDDLSPPDLDMPTYLFQDQAGLSGVGGSYHAGHGRRRSAGRPSLMSCLIAPDDGPSRTRDELARDGAVLVHAELAAIQAALVRNHASPNVNLDAEGLYRTRLAWVAAHEWGHRIHTVTPDSSPDSSDWERESDYAYWSSEAWAELSALERVWEIGSEERRAGILQWTRTDAIGVACAPDLLDTSPHAVAAVLVYEALQSRDPVTEMRELLRRMRNSVMDSEDPRDGDVTIIRSFIEELPGIAVLRKEVSQPPGSRRSAS